MAQSDGLYRLYFFISRKGKLFMPKVQLLKETKAHLTNEQKAQREDAQEQMETYTKLMTTTPPDFMPASAKSEWKRLIPILEKEYPISETDYALLVNYCLAFARIKTAENEIRKSGTFITNENTGIKKTNPAVAVQSQAMKDLKSSATSLGFTLEARQRLALNKAQTEEPTDPFQELMEL